MDIKKSAVRRQVEAFEAEEFHAVLVRTGDRRNRQRKMAVAAFFRATVRGLAPGHDVVRLAVTRIG